MDHSKRHLLRAACALAASAGLAACASGNQENRRTAGTFADDSALTAKVKTAIATDVGAGTAAAVNVNTYRGTVQLTGFVDTEEQKRQAATAARNVQGVGNVQNDIRVKGS